VVLWRDFDRGGAHQVPTGEIARFKTTILGDGLTCFQGERLALRDMGVPIRERDVRGIDARPKIEGPAAQAYVHVRRRPGASTPPDAATASQLDGFMLDQVKLVALLCLMEHEVALAEGPPTMPVAVKPAEGVTPRVSGIPAMALMIPWPAGVPQPVQRS